VIPLFVNQLLNDEALTVTDPSMTRFMMSLDQSVELVLFALKHGGNGEIIVQKAPAVTIETLVLALKEMFGKPNHEVNIIGTRHGEKLYETLLSREEMSSVIEMDDFFRVLPDTRDLNYSKYFDEGVTGIAQHEDYTSHNTYRLNLEETKELLLNLPFIQRALNGEYVSPRP
jgi:UDP-N-acetylglucosamine 4,6-dehydratase